MNEKKKVIILAESSTLEDASELYKCAGKLESQYEVSYMLKSSLKRVIYSLDEKEFLEVLNKKEEKKMEKRDSPSVTIALCFSLVSLILSFLAYLGILN